MQGLDKHSLKRTSTLKTLCCPLCNRGIIKIGPFYTLTQPSPLSAVESISASMHSVSSSRSKLE